MSNPSVNQLQKQTYHSDDEIDIRDLLATLWGRKWVVILFSIVFTAAGIFYAVSKPNIYEASVLLAPAQDEGSAGRISGQLGGLASLAGINMGGVGANQTIMAKEVLLSRVFLTSFIHRHSLVVPLMAAEAWDIEGKRWIIDTTIYNPKEEKWLVDDEGESLEPTDWDIVKTFKEHISISSNDETNMVTVKMKSQSPTAAKEWVKKLIDDINEHMRSRDVQEAEARIAYLEGKLRETNIAGMQQVFYQLIENETRTVMLANAQSEYVFKTIDPAVVPQEKSDPKRVLIAVAAMILGGMLGIFVVFLGTSIRTQKTVALEKE
ncbi:Wzz/FepE/Etk N-terminal domain-containing protein [Marinobacter sp. 2_MG-2023]|uniref:Wzz/FepE/Etk N-terminal domain-containing protein n=1 Tax=Marinobacter sp. 2_MG-2023 TaxID=3062679 RepID=UPI0026E3035D|nr:Wzz/FepE/Etk N-terminal domain-containing protein [Marinobacter sp. 2_MG-2023]MDO6443714.1 Wzz/FepE/Etk N-terminal domain-containing protein [Marinobacter sp. 2_MG-2023]